MSDRKITTSFPEIEEALNLLLTPQIVQITSILRLATTHDEYEKQMTLFEFLMATLPDEPNHPLNWLLCSLGKFIVSYEQQQFSNSLDVRS